MSTPLKKQQQSRQRMKKLLGGTIRSQACAMEVAQQIWQRSVKLHKTDVGDTWPSLAHKSYMDDMRSIHGAVQWSTKHGTGYKRTARGLLGLPGQLAASRFSKVNKYVVTVSRSTLSMRAQASESAKTVKGGFAKHMCM